jgi:hypothetical protein
MASSMNQRHMASLTAKHIDGVFMNRYPMAAFDALRAGTLRYALSDDG